MPKCGLVSKSVEWICPRLKSVTPMKIFSNRDWKKKQLALKSNDILFWTTVQVSVMLKLLALTGSTRHQQWGAERNIWGPNSGLGGPRAHPKVYKSTPLPMTYVICFATWSLTTHKFGHNRLSHSWVIAYRDPFWHLSRGTCYLPGWLPNESNLVSVNFYLFTFP